MKQKNRSAFTLIELLVAIAIIGILATLLFANFSSIRERGRDVRRKSDLEELKKSLRLYYNDYQKHPAAGAGNTIAGLAWGSAFTVSGQVYMNTLPQDPGGKMYAYYSNAGENYCLVAELENAGDKELAVSRSRCAAVCKTTAGAPDFTVSPQPTANLKLYAACND